jgi:hypothetical protein
MIFLVGFFFGLRNGAKIMDNAAFKDAKNLTLSNLYIANTKCQNFYFF